MPLIDLRYRLCDVQFGIAALFLTLSGGARKIYLESRALYNFVVGFTDSVNLIFWIAAALFLLLSVGLFLMYRKLYLKAKKG